MFESLDDAVRSLAAALRTGDADRVDRAFRGVARSVHALDGMLAGLGVHGADLDDLHQELLGRLHDELHEGAELVSPRAWLRTVARHLACDQLRRRARQATPVAPERLAEQSGVYALEDVFAREREEHEHEQRRAQLHLWVEGYVRAADALRPPRGHHVRAWHARRIEGRAIADIGKELAEPGETPGADCVSKWVQRGAELVRALAARDDDPVRAAALRRATA